jgi:hypothetical protein
MEASIPFRSVHRKAKLGNLLALLAQMEKTPPSDNPISLGSKPFEFQNWPVYAKAIAFAKTVHQLCDGVPKDGKRGPVDQISRASQSISLNVAEGCARSTSKDKANFFRVAKGVPSHDTDDGLFSRDGRHPVVS